MIKKKVLSGWGYARVSTKTQANVQHGSLEQQAHIISRWVARESENPNSPYQLVLERVLEEDISGREEKLHQRTQYQEIVSAIKKREIDFLVFEKVDRLGRNSPENNRLVDLAAENGVLVYDTECGLIDLSDKSSRFNFYFKNYMAQEYVLDLEEKISKKQREARVNNGKDTNTVPILGLDRHPSKVCMYVINREEQLQIIDIFESYLRIGYLNKLSDYCKQKGYKTKPRITHASSDKNGNILKPKSIGGKPFTPKSLRQHLTNKKYLGYSFFKDDWKQFPKLQDENGYVKWEHFHYRNEGPVVPEALFFQVQQLIKKNEMNKSKIKGHGFVYLLQGILFAEDGRALNGASAKGSSVRYYENRKLRLRIRQEKIEKAIIGRVKEYLKSGSLLNTVVSSSLNKAGSTQESLRAAVASAKREIQRLQKANLGLEESLTQAALSGGDVVQVAKLIIAAKNKNEAEIASLSQKVQSLEHQIANLYQGKINKDLEAKIRAVFTALDNGCRATTRRLVQSLISRVIIYKDNRLEIRMKAMEGLSVNGGQKFVYEKNGSGGGSQNP